MNTSDSARRLWGGRRESAIADPRRAARQSSSSHFLRRKGLAHAQPVLWSQRFPDLPRVTLTLRTQLRHVRHNHQPLSAMGRPQCRTSSHPRPKVLRPMQVAAFGLAVPRRLSYYPYGFVNAYIVRLYTEPPEKSHCRAGFLAVARYRMRFRRCAQLSRCSARF